jgi:hypothetical protein
MSDPNQFQPPPPPSFGETPEPATETLSTAATISGIFFEPGRVFEALRFRPRFLVASIIILLFTVGVTVAVYQRVDMGQYIREKMEKSPRNANATPEQKETGVKFGKIAGMVGVPLSVPVTIAAGAALYLLGVMAFGGSITYKKSLAVWVYSSLPQTVLGCVIAVLVLFLKTADTVDPEHLLFTNPGALMGPDASPVLVATLSQFDLLRFYGLVLAAIGLRKIAKLSSGSAWGVVLGFFIIRAILGIASAAIFGG